jgi:hypothetical protein
MILKGFYTASVIPSAFCMSLQRDECVILSKISGRLIRVLKITTQKYTLNFCYPIFQVQFLGYLKYPKLHQHYNSTTHFR